MFAIKRAFSFSSTSIKETRNWNLINPSFRDLRIAEFHRRELLKQAKRFDRKMIYIQLWGTVLPYVFQSWEFWFSLIVYIILRIIIIWGSTHNVSIDFVISTGQISAIGGFISFLLVFYNNQVYTRFLSQYEQSTRMQGRILNAAMIARDYLDKGTAWQFIRYLNGAHLLGYIGLSDTYERHNFFHPFNDSLHLFTGEETDVLDEIDMDEGDACYREVLGWAIGLVADQCKEQKLDIVVYSMLASEVTQIRACIATLYDYRENPIPFLYVHLVYFLVLFYLPLFAYFIATSFSQSLYWGNIDGLLIIMINNIFTVGLLEICKFMCEPYGTDLCDLSVMHFIEYVLENSRRILHGQRFKSNGLTVEEALEKSRPHIGDGFVTAQMTEEVFNKALEDRFPVCVGGGPEGCATSFESTKLNRRRRGSAYWDPQQHSVRYGVDPGTTASHPGHPKVPFYKVSSFLMGTPTSASIAPSIITTVSGSGVDLEIGGGMSGSGSVGVTKKVLKHESAYIHASSSDDHSINQPTTTGRHLPPPSTSGKPTDTGFVSNTHPFASHGIAAGASNALPAHPTMVVNNNIRGMEPTLLPENMYSFSSD